MPIRSSLDNDLFLSYWQEVSAPAAGANRSFAIPGAGQVELVLLSFSLTTDANVANRIVTLELITGGKTIRLGSSAFPHVASSTYHYIGHQNPVTNAAGNVQDLMIPLPSLRLYDPSATMNIIVNNKQAADQISTAFAYWKMWRAIP